MNIGGFQSDKSWNKSENDKLGALPEKKNKEEEEEDQKTSKKNNNRVEYHSSNTRHFSQFRAELLNNTVRQILKEN